MPALYHVRDIEVNTLVLIGSGTTQGMDTLASRLRSARAALGLSQTELAQRAKVAQSTVGNIESGARGGASSLARLAAVLGVRYEWLRDGEPPMRAPSTKWPFSDELFNQIQALDPDSLRRAENQLRAFLDLPALPRPADDLGKQDALAA